MMRAFAIVISALVLHSCSSEIKMPDAPNDLIGADSMSMLIHDMVILEAGIRTRYQNVNRYYKTMERSGNAFLKSKHISPARYERSYDYYVTRPEEFQAIFTKAMDSITVELNRAN
jgi:hypothetical protein